MVFEIKHRRVSVSIFVECRPTVVKAAIAGKQKVETLKVTGRLRAANVRRIQAPEEERLVELSSETNSTRLEQCQIRGVFETPIALTASGFLHDF